MNSAHYKQGVLQVSRARRNVNVTLVTILCCLLSPVVTFLALVVGVPAALIYVYLYLPYAWIQEREVDSPLHLENLPVIGERDRHHRRAGAPNSPVMQEPVRRLATEEDPASVV